MKITHLSAQLTPASTNHTSLLATIEIDNKHTFSASIPYGISTGLYEAKNILNKDAVHVINSSLFFSLNGYNLKSLEEFDTKLIEIDGTKNKAHLGANTILVLSIAVSRALAFSQDIPLWKYIALNYHFTPAIPIPMMVMIEGGKHGKFPGITWQELLLNGNTSDGQDCIIYLKKYFDKKNIQYTQGSEGGWTANLSNNSEAIELLDAFVQKKSNLTYSLDCAASHDSHNELVQLEHTHNMLFSVEDPLTQNDWIGWQEFFKSHNNKYKIIADDLTVTNTILLKKAIKENVCSGVIIKPNQIGTITETLEFIKMAQDAQLLCIVSHRGIETKDSFIADLAVGVGADYIKTGAPTQPERLAKYARLEDITNKEWKKWSTKHPDKR